MKLKSKSRNKKLLLLLCIPFIAIIAVIIFRYVYKPSNEEILSYVKDAKQYSSKVRYTITNSKGKYTEDTTLYYSKDRGMRIEFGQDRVKIYKDGFISMNDNGDKYEIEENFDEVYPLAFTSSLLSNNIESITDGSEEWGDTEYLEVKITLPFKNNHINWAKLYINKKDKSPIGTKIYDVNNKEKLTIIYKDFNYLDEIDETLF
ncbi:MAG: hypothetical protein E7214_00785 [Clostridium sp.]|nr:hypothetical protein [Clostridium sp.]